MKAFSIVLVSFGLVSVLLGIFVIKDDQPILLGLGLAVVSLALFQFRKKK